MDKKVIKKLKRAQNNRQWADNSFRFISGCGVSQLYIKRYLQLFFYFK